MAGISICRFSKEEVNVWMLDSAIKQKTKKNFKKTELKKKQTKQQ